MATRIIDALLVTLGLDTRPYEEGNRRARKQLGETRKTVNDAADSMGKAVAGAARQFAVAFLGFSSAAGLVKMLANLNQTTAALGYMAKNTGRTAAELRNWSNAAAVAGGSADGLLGTVQAIQKEQTSFLTTGESSWVGYLRQLNVALIDSSGKARDQFDVLRDLAGAYERISSEQGRPTANSLGLAMGIDQGTMNFLLQGPAAIQRLIEQQEKLPPLTDELAQKSADVAAQWELLKQRGTALATVLLGELQPAIEGTLTWLEGIGSEDMREGVAAITTTFRVLGTAVGFVWNLLKLSAQGWRDLIKLGKMAWEAMDPPDWVKNGASTVGKWFSKLAEFPAALDEYMNPQQGVTVNPAAANRSKQTRGIRNNNPGNLRAVGNQPRDKDGFRVFPTMSEGVAAAGAQLDRYRDRDGLNTISGIISKWAPNNENDTAGYIRNVSSAVGKGAYEQLTDADRSKLLAAMFRQESGAAAVSAAGLGIAPGVPSALGAARGVGAGASAVAAGSARGGTVTNTTTIGKVEVHTAATDAGGIAASIQESLQRRGLVAQSNNGMF